MLGLRRAVISRDLSLIESLAREDPEAFWGRVMGRVPAMMFFLLPVFALLLKLTYWFKRRLYMEHLIVALHSHAFLCAGLLVVLLLAVVAAGLAWQFVLKPMWQAGGGLVAGSFTPSSVTRPSPVPSFCTERV